MELQGYLDNTCSQNCRVNGPQRPPPLGRGSFLTLVARVESISPSVMIPEHRLASLLHQVKQTQISKCLYHNTANSPSLYSDHKCDRNQFPLATVQVLKDHSDEVWFVQFSNDGTRLATSSKDNTVIIWDLEVGAKRCGRLCPCGGMLKKELTRGSSQYIHSKSIWIM